MMPIFHENPKQEMRKALCLIGETNSNYQNANDQTLGFSCLLLATRMPHSRKSGNPERWDCFSSFSSSSELCLIVSDFDIRISGFRIAREGEEE